MKNKLRFLPMPSKALLFQVFQTLMFTIIGNRYNTQVLKYQPSNRFANNEYFW